MKTSNKVLIGLFLFITINLVFFNVLLNAQLSKGNIHSEFKEIERISVALKPFHHVVYEGRMFMSYTKNNQSWVERNIVISAGEGKKYRIDMPSNLEPHLDYRYHTDTLFISFNKKGYEHGRSDYVPVSEIPLQLFAPGLSSVSSNYGAVLINEVDQKEPLALYVKNANGLILSYVNLSLLQLHADTNSHINVLNSSHLDTMAITLGNKSFITFTSPMNIKTILPEQLDSTSRISVEGRSDDMKTYLQKSQ